MGNKVKMDILAGVSVDSTGLIVNMSSRGTGARSSIGVDSGKAYFEVYVIGTPNIGLCNEMNNLNTTGWHNNSSFVVQGGSLNFYIGSTYYAYTYSNIANANNPFTVGFALDMNDHVVNIYFNGVLTMDSFLLEGKIENLGTKLYPFLFHGGGSDRRGIAEWNFGATPFKYPIPEGYTSYDGNQSNAKKYLLKDDEGYKRYMREKGAPITYADGTLTASTTNINPMNDFEGVSSGKWYWEQTQNTQWTQIGISCKNTPSKYITFFYGFQVGSPANSGIILDDRMLQDKDRFVYLPDVVDRAGDTVGIALDLDRNTIEFSCFYAIDGHQVVGGL